MDPNSQFWFGLDWFNGFASILPPLLRMGYFWLTLRQDAIEFVGKCDYYYYSLLFSLDLEFFTNTSLMCYIFSLYVFDACFCFFYF